MIDVVFVGASQGRARTASIGCAYGTINALSLAGHRKDGRRWVMFSFFGGGHGGHPEGDGLNHGNAPISTATIPPVEILEAAYPVMFTAMGAAAGQRRRRRSIAAGSARSTRSSLLEERPTSSCSASAAARRRPGVPAANVARCNRFTLSTPDGQRANAADGVEDGSASSLRGASACGSRRRAAAAMALPTNARGGRRRARSRARLCHRRRRQRISQSHRVMNAERMMRHRVIGVDVGGTFTDLVLRSTRPPAPFADRQGAVHARPGSRRIPATASASRRGRSLQVATDRPWHHGRHQCAARAQGARAGHHHHRGLSRCAGNAPPRPAADLGPVGAFRAGRSARSAPRGARARARRRDVRTEVDPRRGRRRRAARALLERGARRVAITFINAYANPAQRDCGRRAGRCARCGRTRMSRAVSEILPEIREFERTSTTALNALSAAGGRRPISIGLKRRPARARISMASC